MTSHTDYAMIELDNRARIYFEDVLGLGKELSKSILKNIDLKDGKVFSILPRDLVNDKIYDFYSGGKLEKSENFEDYQVLIRDYPSLPVLNANGVLARLIETVLKNRGIHTCIFENAASLKTDQYIQKAIKENRFPIVVLNDSVFYYFSTEFFYDQQAIKEVIKICNSIWHFVCVLTTFEFNKTNTNDLNTQTIDQLVSNARGIVVGAYDGESYLIWSKDDSFTKLIKDRA